MVDLRDRGVSRRTVLQGTVASALALTGVSSVVAKGRGNPSGGGKGRGNNDADRYDTDGNGFPDEGVEVTGMYKAFVAYDAQGNQYLRNYGGIGRESGDLDALDDETTTRCYYKVQYRGTFGNDPFQNTGWIKNAIVCKGYEPFNQNVLWVHESDPRYTGDRPQPSFGEDWETHVNAQRGRGNVVITEKTRPKTQT